MTLWKRGNVVRVKILLLLSIFVVVTGYDETRRQRIELVDYRLFTLDEEKDTTTVAGNRVRGILFDVRFSDRDLYVETFNGEFRYDSLDNSELREILNDLLILECKSEDRRGRGLVRSLSPSQVSSTQRIRDEHTVEAVSEVDWSLRVAGVSKQESALHRYASLESKTNDDDDAIHATILLDVDVFEIDTGRTIRRYENPLLRSLGGDAANASSSFDVFLRSACKLRLLSNAEQNKWPIRTVANNRGHRARLVRGDVSESRRRHRPIERRFDVFAAPTAATISTKANTHHHHLRNFERRYPEVHESWHPVVPPIPNYCALEDGSLSLDDAHRLRVHHETLFIETRTLETVGIPGLDKILNPVMEILMPPIFDPFGEELTKHTSNTLGSETSHEANSQAPNDAAGKIVPALKHNLVSSLPDLLSAHLTESITADLTMQIGPRVLEDTSRALVPKLHRDIVDVLTRSIPSRMTSALPYLLERSLGISLTRTLVRSVTHALTPAIVYGLSRTPDQAEICASCYRDGSRCEECRLSAFAQRSTNYYSAYYAGYYAEYYQAYYVESLEALDRTQHNREENQKAADAEGAKGARDHNLGRAEFSRPMMWHRPM